MNVFFALKGIKFLLSFTQTAALTDVRHEIRECSLGQPLGAIPHFNLLRGIQSFPVDIVEYRLGIFVSFFSMKSFNIFT